MKSTSLQKKNGDTSSTKPAKKKYGRKMPKTPLYILLTFIVIQLAPALVVVPTYNYFLGQGLDPDTAEATTSGWLIVSSMAIGFIIMMILVLRDKNFFNIWNGKKAGLWASIGWGVLGFFLVYFGQIIASLIEMKVLGIEPGSENTMSLVSVAEVVPLTILAIVFFGPVMEELVFRRVVFGSLNQTTNFFIATAISALVFALVHLEFSHLLVYFSTGLVLAFIYQKTKRIITPIIAHILLNAFVMLIQLNMDKIEAFTKYLEGLQP